MSGPYDDIINLPHHVSVKRSHLSMEMRAAQFSAFAALTGFESVIEETRERHRLLAEDDENKKDFI